MPYSKTPFQTPHNACAQLLEYINDPTASFYRSNYQGLNAMSDPYATILKNNGDGTWHDKYAKMDINKEQLIAKIMSFIQDARVVDYLVVMQPNPNSATLPKVSTIAMKSLAACDLNNVMAFTSNSKFDHVGSISFNQEGNCGEIMPWTQGNLVGALWPFKNPEPCSSADSKNQQFNAISGAILYGGLAYSVCNCRSGSRCLSYLFGGMALANVYYFLK